METKKHYVITLSTGSYDDVTFQVVAITDDFEKGSAYVEHQNSTLQAIKQKKNDFNNKEIPKWIMNNPKPVYREKEKDIKLCKNKEELSEANRFNKAIEKEFHKDYSNWIKLQHVFFQSWLAHNLSEEEKEMYKKDEYSDWEIEEVSYL